MMLIHFGLDNTGIHTYPICVGCYDTETHVGTYYVIKPVEYWIDSGTSREACPTREEALKYGLDVARVAYNLNRILNEKIVYTTNAIETVDCLKRIYESCGDCPTFEVENVIELIPREREPEYTPVIAKLNRTHSCCFPLEYCIKVHEILKQLIA